MLHDDRITFAMLLCRIYLRGLTGLALFFLNEFAKLSMRLKPRVGRIVLFLKDEKKNSVIVSTMTSYLLATNGVRRAGKGPNVLSGDTSRLSCVILQINNQLGT